MLELDYINRIMNYKIEKGEIYISISASNEGRFRFKTRKDNFQFGKNFATRSQVFNNEVYLEWQIGYDVTEKEMEKGKKKTKLTNMTFVGRNEKVKHPYELSELIYSAIEIKLISVKSLLNLAEELKEYREYLSDKEIDIQHKGDFSLNGLTFKETSIRLPTFFLSNRVDGTQIEVSIQKQQYAAGVQPMLYFCIPFKSFLNSKELDGRSSEKDDSLIYVINKNNADILLSMFNVFGMASPAHNYDVLEIIKILSSA